MIIIVHKKEEVRQMPGDRLKCPKCGAVMKENKHGVFVCSNPDCKGAFVPAPDSIFGVH